MDIIKDKYYDVIAIRYTKCGVIVELPDHSTQLIHVANISNQFVKDPSDFVIIGNSYQAIGVIGVNSCPQLSLKHLNLCNLNTVRHAPKFVDTSNLDDMIDSAEKVLCDKLKHTRQVLQDRRHRNSRRCNHIR